MLNKTRLIRIIIEIFLLIFIITLIPKFSVFAKDEAEILIFSLSPERVKEKKGVLKIQISTFSPIQKITVRGKSEKFPNGSSLVWLKIPYIL